MDKLDEITILIGVKKTYLDIFLCIFSQVNARMGFLVCREDGTFGNSVHSFVACKVNGKNPLRVLVEIFGDLNRLVFWCKVLEDRIVWCDPGYQHLLNKNWKIQAPSEERLMHMNGMNGCDSWLVIAVSTVYISIQLTSSRRVYQRLLVSIVIACSRLHQIQNSGARASFKDGTERTIWTNRTRIFSTRTWGL